MYNNFITLLIRLWRFFSNTNCIKHNFLILLVLLLNPVGATNQSDKKFEPINVYPLDSLYHRSDDMLTAILSKSSNYSHLVDWQIIGESSNKKFPIYAFSITGTDLNQSKPAVLFHGQHHGEEPIGVEIVMYLSKYLLSQYEKDDFITYLIDNFELWFIPTSNPEGFEIVNSGEYRLKRKNETDTNMNGTRDLNKDGVDLNRNYPFNWEDDASFDPESPYFKGFEAACQAETQSMIKFYKDINFDLAFFYHSSASGAYSERIFFPWKWGDKLSPDYHEMHNLATTLAANLPKTYQEGYYKAHTLNTSQRSFARDYIYSQHRTLAMLIEVGGNSPYGEGITNPPDEVLKFHLQMQTNAMLNLLKEFSQNLLTVRVVNNNNEPLPEVEVFIDGRESSYTQNIVTNKDGYFHVYLLPREKPYEFIIKDEHFTFLKTNNTSDILEFRLASNKKAPNLHLESLNNREAIIMLDTNLQNFPALKVKGEYDRLSMYLLNWQTIAYYRIIDVRNNQINIPWIPTNVIDKGILTFQNESINPLADNIEPANKIVFLSKDVEKLTYCIDKSNVNHFYLHPKMKIGIDYSLYYEGGNNYYIDSIKICGHSEDNQSNLSVSLYDGPNPLIHTVADYKGNEITFNKGCLSAGRNNHFLAEIEPHIMLPNNLYLVISNNSANTISIAHDKVNSVNSKRSQVYYSSWQKLRSPDLAVELILKKE